MTQRHLLTIATVVTAAATSVCRGGVASSTETAARVAAVKSLALIQKSTAQFNKAVACASCHHESLPLLVFDEARKRGVTIDENLARAVAQKTFGMLQSVDIAVQGSHIIDPQIEEGMLLSAAATAGVPKSLTTGVMARRMANWQRPEGNWRTFDRRPPASISSFTATAYVLRATASYMPDQLTADRQARVGRAIDWLIANKPADTEDAAYRVMALVWGKAAAGQIANAAADLLKMQSAEGGWPQCAGRASDAYGTGVALAALKDAGLIASPEYQRAVGFLLKTQRPDGSWLVESRLHTPAPISPPYFETGFPFGHNQILSMMGTEWATMALLATLPAADNPAKPLPLTGVTPPEAAPWMETAAFGRVDELEKLLDSGLDVNSRTQAGTSLLMMAAHDPAKVKLLLDRGANATAVTKTGFNALLVSSVYQGNVESSRLLMDAGAKILDKGVLFNASPLFYATYHGDREMIEYFVEKGAPVNRITNMVGMVPMSPIMMATLQDNASLARYLISKGARLNDPPMSMLAYAAIANAQSVAQVMLDAGIKVDAVDAFGYTPLMHAVSINTNDSSMAQFLRDHGASLGVKNKQGQTPGDLSRKYGTDF